MALPQSAQEIISLLDLSPHPEGGYFKETYRDPSTITSTADATPRSASSLIYFLLESHNFSRLHRIDAAEAWHFYAGTRSLEVVELTASGARITRLGTDLAAGERPQYVVGKGTWFGARVAEGGSGRGAADGLDKGWVLVGCTVAPAFLFDKFQMGERKVLMEQFPACSEVVVALTPED